VARQLGDDGWLAALDTSTDTSLPPRAPYTSRVPSGDHTGGEVTSPVTLPSSVVLSESTSRMLSLEPSMIAIRAPVGDHDHRGCEPDVSGRDSCSGPTTHDPASST
jgi:hypothetical protein